MDRRNLCDVARELYETESARDTEYNAFLAGAAFMHARLEWLIGQASFSEDGMLDPAMLDWVRRDLNYAMANPPDWQTRPAPVRPPALPARNVLSDARRNDAAYAVFGEGWNPDRFETMWRAFCLDILEASLPDAIRNAHKGTFLAGISSAFYDISKCYVLAANARNPDAFRLYLRDFRRSLERVTQAPEDASKMH